MKKMFLVIFFFIFIKNLMPIEYNQNYIQIYGEGPIGRHPINFDVKVYSKNDAVLYAKREIFEFLSGMVYGYNFLYKVENKITKTKGYFDLNLINKIDENVRDITLTQVEESQISIKIQALYRLNDDQKNYISGFKSILAKISSGEARDSWAAGWDQRLSVYKNALKNAVLNNAKQNIKSRPQYIKGKIILNNNPVFIIDSGEWRCLVKTHIIINDIKYIESY